MPEQKEQWQLDYEEMEHKKAELHQFTKGNGYVSLSDIAKDFDCSEEFVRSVDKHHTYDVYNWIMEQNNEIGARVSQKDIDYLKELYCDPYYVTGIRRDNIKKDLVMFGYKSESQKRKDKEIQMKKDKEGLIKSMGIDDCNVKINRVMSLDQTIMILCSGNNTSDITSKAVTEYAKNPEEDVREELKKIPLKKISKSVKITMDSCLWEVVDQLCNNQKLATAIIEVAIWKYMKEI